MVLLDFWADWCLPCKTQKIVLNNLEKEVPEIDIVKINIEEDPEDLTNKFKVKALPTLILLEDKDSTEPLFRVSGYTPIDILKLHIKDATDKLTSTDSQGEQSSQS